MEKLKPIGFAFSAMVFLGVVLMVVYWIAIIALPLLILSVVGFVVYQITLDESRTKKEPKVKYKHERIL
jgi:drug/metabolite transporter (DMT)-like permease